MGKPPTGAGLVSDAVQLVCAPEAMLAGAHVRDERAGGAETVNEAVFDTLFQLAVMTAGVSVVTAAAVAVNVAVVAPAATVTEAGTVRAMLLLERSTAAPPAGAAAVSLTVQAAEEPEATLVGVQVSVDNVGGVSPSVKVLAPPL